MKSKTRRNIIVSSAATLTGLAVAGATSTQTNAQQDVHLNEDSLGRFDCRIEKITYPG